ncbi:MAG: DUF523 and DUF1722 domain-containing protein [Candidatus Eisenbacteria bacterium]|nr:DUF523 and DUF1722 domain-containing protein [Candidatus Eisenbacteria bacterium]
MNDRPRIGISACLLGEKVRYDGQHSRDHFLTDTFGKFVEWVPVCPEVECGLGTPREPMHLEGDPDDPRLVTIRTKQDRTRRMKAWARARARELEKEDLAGYIFKSGSPSSGMERVKVYDARGVPRKVGVGVFARAFMDRFPLLPVEDEGRLHDAVLRENFIESVFCLKRYRDAVRRPRTLGALVSFHAAHKLVLMAHSPKHLKEMGALVARGKALRPSELIASYERFLLAALSVKTTTGKNANVLMHALGYFKDDLTPDEKKEMLGVIEDYRREYVPLIVPVTLLRHYVGKYDQPYLKEQAFLNPHPTELKLRNHA